MIKKLGAEKISAPVGEYCLVFGILELLRVCFGNENNFVRVTVDRYPIIVLADLTHIENQIELGTAVPSRRFDPGEQSAVFFKEQTGEQQALGTGCRIFGLLTEIQLFQ